MLEKIKKYLGILIISSIMSQVMIPVEVCADAASIKEKIKINDNKIGDLKKQKEKQSKNQKNLESRILSVTNQMENLSSQIKHLNKQTYGKQEEINSLIKTYNNMKSQVNKIDDDMVQLNKDSNQLSKELAKYIKHIYMTGYPDLLETLISSKNYADCVTNMAYAKKISERTKNILEEYKEKINSINFMKNVKEKEMENINNVRKKIEEDVAHNNEKSSQIEGIRKEEYKRYKTLEQLLNQNKTESTKIQKAIKTYEKMKRKLNTELDSSKAINNAINEHKSNKPNDKNNEKDRNEKNNKNEKDQNIKSNIKPGKGHIFPVLGHASISQHAHKGHRAVDIQTGGKANLVVASDDGVVITAAKGGKGNHLSGYGNVVIILHDNNETTLYAHLSSILVAKGQRVKKGQVIGRVGNTGRTRGLTGMHLHYERRKGGKKLDPKFLT